MTAQAQDILIMDGQARPLASLPLQAWLDARGIDLKQRSRGYTTSLWRGYKGCWELQQGQLYLIGLLDFENQPFDSRRALDPDPAGTAGPGLPLRADWFSGRLLLPHGHDMSYHHMGWGSTTEWLDCLYVVSGRLVKRRRFDLRKPLRRQIARWTAGLAQHNAESGAPADTPPHEIARLEWLMPAGRRALDLQAEPADAAELAEPPDAWWDEYLTPHLAHCVRAPVPADHSPR